MWGETKKVMKDAGDFKKHWQRRFIKFANKYDDDAGIAGWSASGLETRYRYFTSWFNINCDPPGLWVDLGCGAGSYSRYLQQLGCTVIGVDYSMPSILKAREKSEEKIHWAVADATQLPLRHGYIDGIICFGVTQALPDSNDLIREACTALSDEGEIWVDGLNGWFLPYILKNLKSVITGRPNKLRYESPYTLKLLLKQAGIGGVELLWMPMAPGNALWLQHYLEHKLFRRLISLIFPVGALFSHSFMLSGKKISINDNDGKVDII